MSHLVSLMTVPSSTQAMLVLVAPTSTTHAALNPAPNVAPSVSCWSDSCLKPISASRRFEKARRYEWEAASGMTRMTEYSCRRASTSERQSTRFVQSSEVKHVPESPSGRYRATPSAHAR